jgi:hypothetical protein
MSRNANGTFARGHKFGKGRIKGSRNWATILKQHLRGSEPRVPAMLLDDQLERGRRWAVQVMLGILPRPREPLPELDLSDIRTLHDVLGAQNEIISAVARGEITVDAGRKLSDRLDRHRAGLATLPPSTAAISAP